MLPPSIAAIIECQTDSRLRTLADIRYLIKEAGGTVTPTNHLFDKRGRIVFGNAKQVSDQDIFDRAIEAGVLDITMTDDGKFEVLTEPGQTAAIAKTLSDSLDLAVQSSAIIWVPKDDTMVEIENEEQSGPLNQFLGKPQHSINVGS